MPDQKSRTVQREMAAEWFKLADAMLSGTAVMPDVELLLTQIARAECFAAAMTNDAERQRFATMVAEYQRELEAVEDEWCQRSRVDPN